MSSMDEKNVVEDVMYWLKTHMGWWFTVLTWRPVSWFHLLLTIIGMGLVLALYQQVTDPAPYLIDFIGGLAVGTFLYWLSEDMFFQAAGIVLYFVEGGQFILFLILLRAFLERLIW